MKKARPRLTLFEERVLKIGVALCVGVDKGKFNLPTRENRPLHRIMVAFLRRMKTARQREQVLLGCLANLPEIPDFDIPVTSGFAIKLTRAWKEGKPLPFTAIEFYLLRNWDAWGGMESKDAAAPPLKRWTDECVAQLLNCKLSERDLAAYRKGKHGELTADTYRKIRTGLGLNPDQPPLVRQFKLDETDTVIQLWQAKPAPKVDLSLLR